MASLKGRFKDETEQRLKLLSSDSPISVPFAGITLQDLLDAAEDSSELAELTSVRPMAPQLQCDFYVKVTARKGFSTVYNLSLQKDVILTEFSTNPSSLDWDYMSSPINFPNPVAKSTVCSLTVLQPSAPFTPHIDSIFSSSTNLSNSNAYQKLLSMYEDQFSKSGLLQLPENSMRVEISVGLLLQTRSKGYYLTNRDGEPQPLFTLDGVRFSTPQYLFNPASDEATGIKVPFTYERSTYLNFTKAQGIEWAVLPEDYFSPTNEQLSNRS